MYLFLLIDDNKMGIFLKASDVSFKIYTFKSTYNEFVDMLIEMNIIHYFFIYGLIENYGNYTIDYHDKSLHHSQK